MILAPIQSHVNTLHYAALACYSVIRALVRETGPVYERPVPFPYSQEVCDIKRLAAERRDDPLRERVQWTMVPPACSFVFPGGGLVDPLLRVSNETLPTFLHFSLEGVAEAALYCAHRTSTFLSCAFCEQGGHLAAPFPSFRFRAPRKGCRGRRRSERPSVSSLLIAEVQAGRIICTAASLSILPTGDTFPSFSLRTIRSICTMAPRCQLSRAVF